LDSNKFLLAMEDSIGNPIQTKRSTIDFDSNAVKE